MRGLLLILMVMINFGSYSQEFNKEDISATILLEKAEDLLTISGLAKNSTSLSLPIQYKLIVIRESNGNQSNNKQGGLKEIPSGESAKLSETSINQVAGDKLFIELSLYVNDKLVNTETISQPEDYVPTIIKRPKPKKQAKELSDLDQSLLYDGEILTGIVIDETRTKIGKDFYDYFFTEHDLNLKSNPYLVIIKEAPMFGRTTRLIVVVDDKEIFVIPSQPRQEYLEDMAKQAISRVSQYIDSKRINKMS